jgi:steroid 5-alpha reductase family enzyme
MSSKSKEDRFFRSRSLMIVLAVNVVSILAGAATFYISGDWHPVWAIALADLVATAVIFVSGTLFGNASMYDPWWSVAPPLIVLFWVMLPDQPGPDSVRLWLVAIPVFWWGIRLTYNWARGWPGMNHEDWRYVDLRQKSGVAFFLVNLSGIHIFPTVQVFLGCLPLYPALALNTGPVNFLDILAFLVMISAVLIEAVADRQLHAFKRTRPGPSTFLKTGLWAWCRHPNYLGEVLFWWGIFLFGLSAGWEYWWTGVGAVCITLMFVFISIPMIDKRMLAKRPAYQKHMKKVPALFPKIPVT